MTSKQIKAIATIVFGAGQAVNGAVTATGHGMFGTMCRNSRLMGIALCVGKRSMDKGKARVAEGMKEWREANRQ